MPPTRRHSARRGISRATTGLLHALPIFHTHGLFVAMNITLMAGRLAHLPPELQRRRDHSALAPGDRDDGRAHLLYPPAGAARFHTRARCARTPVRLVRPLSAETHKEFEARTGHKILERYGMTETNMNTSNPYSGERIAGSVGFPLPAWRSACGPADRTPAAAGRSGRDRHPRPERVQGLLAHARKDKEEFREDGFSFRATSVRGSKGLHLSSDAPRI